MSSIRKAACAGRGAVKTKLLIVFPLSAILSWFSPQANAQTFSINISADENGNGHFTNTVGFSSALPFALQQDPGPGGLADALTYGLLNPPGLVAGDVILLDPTLLVSDVIRFNPNESISGTTGAAVFYSLVGGGSLADIGLPTALYTNVFDITEINGGATYTPIAGQPGFVTGAGGPVTYAFTSDEPTAVPIPGTLPFFASGLAALGLLTWRKKRKALAGLSKQ